MWRPDQRFLRTHGAGTAAAGVVPVATAGHEKKIRARDLGVPFVGQPGAMNSIIDVAGVAVGHCTIIHGEGEQAVRTGVTAVLPRGLGRESSCYAGWFSMNGCGELTGLPWVEESGIATGPYMITGTGSVGLVHDAVLLWAHQRGDVGLPGGGLPIVGETYDGRLSLGRHDSVTQPVSPEHVIEALETASNSFVEEGCVGGGTGMITHGFKGGIGSSSRLVDCGRHGSFTVGVLVQSNYGSREQLRIAGAPVGEELADSFLPSSPPVQTNSAVAHAQGSIIVYVATDAPLLPHQLKRMAKRPTLGLGRMVSTDPNAAIGLSWHLPRAR